MFIRAVELDADLLGVGVLYALENGERVLPGLPGRLLTQWWSLISPGSTLNGGTISRTEVQQLLAATYRQVWRPT